MKVLLINPPKHQELHGSTPAVLESNRGSNPPLGILFIAAVLEKAGHDVKVIDTQVEEYSYEEIEQIIKDADYDLLGLTVMTFTLIDSLDVSRIAKKHHPEKPIVWGGPHVHIFYEESAKFSEVDFVITGEGEISIMQLVEHLQDERPWKDVIGVGRFQEGKYQFNGTAPTITELDELPFPARHLVPYKKYNSILTKGDTVTTLFTSRGCPYKCTFCDRPALRPNFRARSAISVADELEECVKMGIDEFIIYDDTFTVSKQRVHEICDEIINRNLNIHWDCRTNINAMDEALLNHMAEAGCVGIHFGVEAGTEKIQKVIRKNLRLDKVAEIFMLTRKAGIKVMAYFIIGNPTETKEDVEEGFRFLQKLRADFVHITTLMPFPATEIYNEGLRKGIIKYDYWKEFAKNPDPNFIAPHWPEIFSEQELMDLTVEGYKRFYLRPAYIWQRVLQIRSFLEFKKNFRIGLGMLFMKAKGKSAEKHSFFDFGAVREC